MLFGEPSEMSGLLASSVLRSCVASELPGSAKTVWSVSGAERIWPLVTKAQPLSVTGAFLNWFPSGNRRQSRAVRLVCSSESGSGEAARVLDGS